MSDIQDFFYELNRYTTQAHTLKDCYDKLSESEKQLIMSHAPVMTDPPNIMFEHTVEWVRSLHEHFAVGEKE